MWCVVAYVILGCAVGCILSVSQNVIVLFQLKLKRSVADLASSSEQCGMRKIWMSPEYFEMQQ